MCEGCYEAAIYGDPPPTADELAEAGCLADLFDEDMHYGALHCQIDDDNYDLDVSFQAGMSDAEAIAANAWNAASERIRALAVGMHNGYANAYQHPGRAGSGSVSA